MQSRNQPSSSSVVDLHREFLSSLPPPTSYAVFAQFWSSLPADQQERLYKHYFPKFAENPPESILLLIACILVLLDGKVTEEQVQRRGRAMIFQCLQGTDSRHLTMQKATMLLKIVDPAAPATPARHLIAQYASSFEFLVGICYYEYCNSAMILWSKFLDIFAQPP